MNIEELEFILKLQNDLDLTCANLGDICCELDSNENLENIENVAIWCVKNQLDLVVENFDGFRKKMNGKYESEWIKKYPHIKKLENE